MTADSVRGAIARISRLSKPEVLRFQKQVGNEDVFNIRKHKDRCDHASADGGRGPGGDHSSSAYGLALFSYDIGVKTSDIGSIRFVLISS